MIIVMQSTVDFLAKKNPNSLKKFEDMGKPDIKELGDIKYYKFKQISDES